MKYCKLLVLAAAMLLTTSCTTHIALGMFMPSDGDIKDLAGSTWPSFELGGVVAPERTDLLIRGGIGFTSESEKTDLGLFTLDFTLAHLTLRLSALYMIPNTGPGRGSGLYVGGGLTSYAWFEETKMTNGSTTTDSENGDGTGINLIVGYRFSEGLGMPSVFGELIYESIHSSDFDDLMGESKNIGGITLFVGIGF